MADFSLTTVFVAPVGQTAYPSSGSTQDLTAGQIGIFTSTYALASASTVVTTPYFYIAQGRENTYLQGSKRSDKISGRLNTTSTGQNVTEWYKIKGTTTANVQITDVTGFTVQAGEDITLTLRARSSYLETLYFNGFTRSVTVAAECLACDGDPCANINVNTLINALITKLNATSPGINPDNISLSKFFTFTNVSGTTLRITAKALTVYGQSCDVAAFPYEFDRMFFRTFVTPGPATTADFIVDDKCNTVATVTVTQQASYPTGTSAEIAQLEKNFYSYQAGYLKHLYRMNGYNQNFESYVSAGIAYDTYYIKFNEYNKSEYVFGDFITQDSSVVIAIPIANTTLSTAIETRLVAALGAVVDENVSTTTTTTTV
jgi:hypothetical protein